MRRIYVLLLVGFAACAWGARADAKDNAIEASGAIETVTVYRGQALVARLIEVDAPRGSLELVVTDLPTHILPGSLYASGEGEVQIRAVRYRSRSVKEEPREEIRKIDKQIEDIDRRLRENQAMQTLQAQHQDYLTKLEGFTAATAKVEMSKGVLNADTIKSLTEFLANRREGLVKRTLELGEAARALKKEKSHLLSKRHEITTKSTRTAREAIVFLEKPDGGRLKVRLNYLVRQAGWSPMYNLRCKGDRKKVDLEYIALVRQMSGEDWKGVGLTLSTASPAMVAEAPIITPFWVTLGARPQSTLRGAAEVYQKQKAAGGRLRGAWQQRKQVLSQKDALKQDWDLNRPANDLQMLDFAARREILLAARVRPTEEALSVNYVLPGKISIPSRSDQQMIQIASLVLPAKFYYLAAPVLTPYVYQQADVVNSSEVAFLSGPLNSYMDGQFMGTGRMPMVARGQQFAVGFGVDSQLRTTRELADKTDRVQGGNRELTFKYRLLIENYKDKPVEVRLMDRLPDPKGADIRITLGELKDPLSENKVYLRTLRKVGILRWEVDVPAKAAEDTARIVEYQFKMTFDRKMHIVEPSQKQIEQPMMEFEEMMSP